jgi:hypothetical protein
MQNQIERARTTQHEDRDAKKPYARPELVKHGNVESQTQVQIGPSGPIYTS